MCLKNTRKIALLLVLIFSTEVYAQFENAVVAYAMGQYEKALQIFMPLAESTNQPYAQYYLGVMYENGQGVKQDYQTAERWYRRASEQGISQAQFRLAELYATGKGVDRDYEQAYAWYSTAVNGGHKSALEGQKQALEKLTADELNEAKKLAEEYTTRYLKK